mmetsp:Transcript_116746/g.174301  ORF Transcript_116746/g.174301 Transcript_116746/m.174301 type:complete len:154 (+) Transcript_116746:2187-2648(+)
MRHDLSILTNARVVHDVNQIVVHHIQRLNDHVLTYLGPKSHEPPVQDNRSLKPASQEKLPNQADEVLDAPPAHVPPTPKRYLSCSQLADEHPLHGDGNANHTENPHHSQEEYGGRVNVSSLFNRGMHVPDGREAGQGHNRELEEDARCLHRHR